MQFGVVVVELIGHFRVPPDLCIKMRLSAQPLIWNESRSDILPDADYDTLTLYSDTLRYFVIPCDTSRYLVVPPVALICCLAVVDFMTYFFLDFLCVYFQREKIVTNQLSHVTALTVCL